MVSFQEKNGEGLQKLQNYSEALEKINNKNTKEGSRVVELFFSFDIVNSSLYKDTNLLNWQGVLTILLSDLQKRVTREIPKSNLWRVLGDEIIFCITIKKIDEIYSTIDSIFKILIQENGSLKNESFFDIIDHFSDNEKIWMKKNNILGIQSAAWIAIVCDGKKADFSPYDNYLKKYKISENHQINNFIGKDIDAGFRIKKETQERRLVVSVELAKLLSDRTDYLSRLHIITYKSLKGVWKNRLYPIIWYHNNIRTNLLFDESFYYDETENNQLSKDYFINRENTQGNIASYMFLDVSKALSKIIKDQNLDDKIKKIQEIISETDTDTDTRVLEEEFDDRLLEFHCAAVCCDIEKRKVLIVKRNKRKIYPGLWEFGCAKASIDKNLCDSIKEDYKFDFGLDIDVICDNREDREPKPIALYQVNKVDKLQKGVIVMAKIISNIDSVEKTIKERGKHDEFKWISQEDVSSFDELAINDFKDTLEKVFSLWDIVFKEK